MLHELERGNEKRSRLPDTRKEKGVETEHTKQAEKRVKNAEKGIKENQKHTHSRRQERRMQRRP